jgi:hypothetical protein
MTFGLFSSQGLENRARREIRPITNTNIIINLLLLYSQEKPIECSLALATNRIKGI